jgi:hypothetical protein
MLSTDFNLCSARYHFKRGKCSFSFRPSSLGFGLSHVASFRNQATQIAHDLSNFQARYNISDRFSDLWSHMKALAPAHDEERVKRILRAQGCSRHFMRSIDRLIELSLDCPEALEKMIATRFKIGLRLAVHLSSDRGAGVFRYYDEVFAATVLEGAINPSIASAYSEFKVRTMHRGQ